MTDSSYPSTSRLIDLISEVTSHLNQGGNFEVVLKTMYEKVQRLLPCDRLQVAFVKPDTTILVMGRVFVSGRTQLGTRFREDVRGTALEERLQTGDTLGFEDLSESSEGIAQLESTQHLIQEGIRSLVYFPLIAAGKSVALVGIGASKENAYNQYQIDALKTLVGQLAGIAERERLISRLRADNRRLIHSQELQEQFTEKLEEEIELRTTELRRKEKELSLILELAKALHETLDLKKNFETLINHLNDIIDFDRAGILFLKPELGYLQIEILFSKNSQEQLQEEAQVPVSGSAAGKSIELKEAISVSELSARRDFYEDSFFISDGIQSYVSIPLFTRNVPMGVFQLGSKQVHSFNEEAVSFLVQLSQQLSVAVANAELHGSLNSSSKKLAEENIHLREVVNQSRPGRHLIGDSRAWRNLLREVEAVSQTDTTVLILGETGTGKEMVAREIHRLSPRRDKPFIAINCGVLTDDLLASDLFGHEKGAFTGAVEKRLGRIELAEGGTLFLDEIAEMGLSMQVKLLRVLQEREYERLGGEKTLRSNVRILAATNRNLLNEVESKRFREDLYYRLNIFPVRLPCLRERLQDIEPFLLFFLDQYSKKIGKNFKSIDPQSIELCKAYPWPGNVRELENVIARSVIISPEAEFSIDPQVLNSKIQRVTERSERITFDDRVRTILTESLIHSQGKIYGSEGAAEALNLKPSTLQAKLAKYGIDRTEFKG